MPDVRIVATADVYASARNLAFGDRPIVVSHRVAEYGDYRRLLESKDVDVVVIGAPNHWHVAMTWAAVVAFFEASKQIVQVDYLRRLLGGEAGAGRRVAGKSDDGAGLLVSE